MKKKFVLSAMAMILMASTVQAAEWYLLGDQHLELFLVDRATRTVEGNRVSMWVTGVNINPKLKYDTDSTLMKYDCESRKIYMGYMVQFLRGKVIESVDFSSMATWDPVIPGSNGDRQWHFACNKPLPKDATPVYLNEFNAIDYAGGLAGALQPAMRELKKHGVLK